MSLKMRVVGKIIKGVYEVVEEVYFESKKNKFIASNIRVKRDYLPADKNGFYTACP